MDDGAAVYLNGTNILNYQLAHQCRVQHAGDKRASHQRGRHLVQLTRSIPPLLGNGTNTLAVEIHQAAVNDPDLSLISN
jgi:hypothetical protein